MQLIWWLLVTFCWIKTSANTYGWCWEENNSNSLPRYRSKITWAYWPVLQKVRFVLEKGSRSSIYKKDILILLELA